MRQSPVATRPPVPQQPPTPVTPDRLDPECIEAVHRAYWRTRDPALEGLLVDHHAGLAVRLARRVAVGADAEDALQVARCALLLALRRYDPDRGVAFTTFAWATVSGELKRFVRDTCWVVRVDRGTQERHLRVTGVYDELSGELGREPSPSEVSARSGLAREAIDDALAVRTARRPSSINAPATGSDGPQPQEDRLGEDDPGFVATEEGDVLRGLLGHLPPLDRRLVWGYWGEGRTQSQLAAEAGLTQMQVSRILRRALDRLRAFAAVAH